MGRARPAGAASPSAEVEHVRSPAATRSVMAALAVLEQVSVSQPVGVSELARELGLPKSTIQRALVTLREAGWIQGAPGAAGRWSLAAKAAVIGRRAYSLQLREAAGPALRRLSATTGETVDLFEPSGDGVALVARVEGTAQVRALGSFVTPAPAHATAAGKAMLAHLPEGRLHGVLARGLTSFTATTIVDPEALRAELAVVRARGYAVNRGEQYQDISAVAAPVVLPNGVVAAVSIVVPTYRFDDAVAAELGPLAVRAAGEVQERLTTWDPDLAGVR